MSTIRSVAGKEGCHEHTNKNLPTAALQTQLYSHPTITEPFGGSLQTNQQWNLLAINCKRKLIK